MKKTTMLLLLLALPAFGWAAPKISIESARYDFGEVFEGARVEQVFRFTNTGDASLVIDRVRSSCGCTAALVSSTVIHPGESGEVSTTFDSYRFRGSISKTVFLYTNDPLQPVTQFILTGTVRPELVLERNDIDLGTLVPGEVREVRLDLTNHGQTTVNLTGVEVTSAEVQARFSSPVMAAGGAIQLIVQVQAPAGRERLSGYLIVRTDHPRLKELRLPFFALITPAGR
jgi:hypothetical protein